MLNRRHRAALAISMLVEPALESPCTGTSGGPIHHALQGRSGWPAARASRPWPRPRRRPRRRPVRAPDVTRKPGRSAGASARPKWIGCHPATHRPVDSHRQAISAGIGLEQGGTGEHQRSSRNRGAKRKIHTSDLGPGYKGNSAARGTAGSHSVGSREAGSGLQMPEAEHRHRPSAAGAGVVLGPRKKYHGGSGTGCQDTDAPEQSRLDWPHALGSP